MSLLFTLATLIIVLGVLIFVHELGHFLAAKAAGIQVLRFSLGIGPAIRRLTWVRGETEYSISWLPLGGYVKMASAEEAAASEALEGGPTLQQVDAKRVFEAKPVWMRMIVILAGVSMNLLFAWAVYSVLAYKEGRQINPTTTIGQVVADSLPAGAESLRDLPVGARITAVGGKPVASWNEVLLNLSTAPKDQVAIQLDDGTERLAAIPPSDVKGRERLARSLLPYLAPVIGQVLPDHPAERAGMMVGDTVTAVNGAPIPQWYDFLVAVRGQAGVPLVLTVARQGHRIEIPVTPEGETEVLPDGTKRQVGRIGVGVAFDYKTEPYTVGEAVLAGGSATIYASTQIAEMVRGLINGQVDRKNIGGPILIAQAAAQSAKQGLDVFLGFLAFVSVNLAVLNMLPIPVLDGGQFLFLLAEGIFRRPLSLRLREQLTMVGLVLIVLLMVLAFSNDIRRLIGG